MKMILTYAASLLISFVLAMVFGLVLAEEIQKVFYVVSNTLNTKQGS
jgi:hypothetical protein